MENSIGENEADKTTCIHILRNPYGYSKEEIKEAQLEACDWIERLQNDGSCEWKLDDPDSQNYDTECGDIFVLFEDTLAANGMKFCCYCGLKLKTT